MGLYNLPDVITNVAQRILSEIHTCMPAQIVKYDYVTQKADVKPLIQKQYLDGTTESLPIISNVPVIFPRTNNNAFILPVFAGDDAGNAGDTVLIVFAERSLELWLGQGGEQLPGDTRQFDLTDAIAIAGLFPFSNTNTPAPNGDDAFWLGPNGTMIQITKDGDIKITDSATYSATISGSFTETVGGDYTETISGKATINVTGDVTLNITGNVDLTANSTTINGPVAINGTTTITGTLNVTQDAVINTAVHSISLKAHTHGGVTTGPNSTLAPN